jgi:hypothetical protein
VWSYNRLLPFSTVHIRQDAANWEIKQDAINFLMFSLSDKSTAPHAAASNNGENEVYYNCWRIMGWRLMP